MSYNRIGTSKFYIDAVLLARKLGHIEAENEDGLFYLNPTKIKNIALEDNGYAYINIVFLNRMFCNSLTHAFLLGHAFASDSLEVGYYIKNDVTDEISYLLPSGQYWTAPENNGFFKHEWSSATNMDVNRFTAAIRYADYDNVSFPVNHPISFNVGDISIGWSYEMPHTPDLELTQTFANESLKVQTTKGGHTLTNTGWTQPPKWGIYPQWKRSPNIVAYPARRSWNLKFSYLADSDMMPQYYNELDTNNNNRGIFERTSVTIDDPTTSDIDESSQTFSIKNDFLSKVMPTINLGLPFIFQPNKDVEEYAICRVNANSVALNQVAHQVYDVSLDIVEIW